MLNLPKQTFHLPDGSKLESKLSPRNQLKSKARATKQKAKDDRQKLLKERRGTVGPKLKLAVRERDKNLCQLCLTLGTEEDPTVIDHIVPVAQGGRTCESNLATLHKSCNGAKGGRELEIMRHIGHAIAPGAKAPKRPTEEQRPAGMSQKQWRIQKHRETARRLAEMEEAP